MIRREFLKVAGGGAAIGATGLGAAAIMQADDDPDESDEDSDAVDGSADPSDDDRTDYDQGDAGSSNDDSGAASVRFLDQETDGSAVTIDEISLPEGGFVVVHDSRWFVGLAAESAIAVSDRLEPGATDSLELAFDEPVSESETMVAVLYRDANDDRAFSIDEATSDRPYLDENEDPIAERAVVTAASDAET